jgi:ubiquinone/menaquinone biosynthesis C-methylase UbiE
MVLNDRVRDYYRDNPLMVSSPFGGVDGVSRKLLLRVFDDLGIALAGKAVLDVGCGRGYVADTVEAAGGEYTGVDFVASSGRTDAADFAVADAAALPFSERHFDAVLCIDAFEHFPDAGRAAKEFRRVVRADGFVFLSVPNYSNIAGLVKWWCEHLGHYEKDTWAPFRNWQPQELERPLTGARVRDAFRRAGFSRFRRIGYGVEVGIGLFPWMEHRNMPEAAKFRLQRLFAAIGPPIARAWPGSSLHSFWKIGT